MAESLASRVGRIVSGSVNALVDAVENAAPEAVLEQAIREVDGAVDDVRAELGRALAKKHLASQRLLEENAKHEDLTSKIDLALGQGRDDLAEVAVAQQLDIEAQIPLIERTLAECGDQEKELEGFIAALQGKRRQMQDDLAGFREARSAGEAQASDGPVRASSAASSVSSRVEKATSAFDRVVEANTGVPGGVGDIGTAAKLSELEDLARKNRIEERMAQARARAGKD